MTSILGRRPKLTNKVWKWSSKIGTKALKWRRKLPTFCTTKTLKGSSTKMCTWSSSRHSIANRQVWAASQHTAPLNCKRNFHRRLSVLATSSSQTTSRRPCSISSAKSGTCSNKSPNKTLTKTNRGLGCWNLAVASVRQLCSVHTNICFITRL